MRKRLITAATAAVLLLAAAVSDAKPLKVDGGCSSEINVTNGIALHLFQTFKPTFSILKSASFALWGGSESVPLTNDVTLRVSVYSGTPAAGLSPLPGNYSSSGVLLAGTTKADAASGYTVTFTFTDGLRVYPGQDYTFEIYQTDNYPTSLTWVCVSGDGYADGAFYYNTVQQSDDLAFKAAGSGRGTAPK